MKRIDFMAAAPKAMEQGPEKDYHTLYFREIVDCYEID